MKTIIIGNRYKLISPAEFKKLLCRFRFRLPSLAEFVSSSNGYYPPFERHGVGGLNRNRWEGLTFLLAFLIGYSGECRESGMMFVQTDAFLKKLAGMGVEIKRSTFLNHLSDLEKYGFVYRETVYRENPDQGGISKAGSFLILSNWFLEHVQNPNAFHDGHYFAHVSVDNNLLRNFLIGKGEGGNNKIEDADDIFNYLVDCGRRIYLRRRNWTCSVLIDGYGVECIVREGISPLERLYFNNLPPEVIRDNLFDKYYIESLFGRVVKRPFLFTDNPSGDHFCDWDEESEKKICIDVQRGRLGLPDPAEEEDAVC